MTGAAPGEPSVECCTTSALGKSARYDGLCGAELARRVGVPAALVFDEVSSTLDAAHAAAASGAPAGTLVIADAQSAGRGRAGRRWHSARGAGIWLTLIERPADATALGVLSLRVGLALAPVLDAFADASVGLKWPNDLYVAGGKLAGILVEARWRDERPEWTAIGVGINVEAPAAEAGAVGLRPGAVRLDVLAAVVVALRSSAGKPGPLDAAELAAFAERDIAAGRRCTEPVAGVVQGIDATGALVVRGAAGTVAVRAGSLVLAEEGEVNQ
jgi:BirA family biotin operon repressor/biotin-[acetyl-CoA-carboxylase] ligase